MRAFRLGFLLVLYSYASRRLAPPGTGVPLLRFTQRSQEQSALARLNASIQTRLLACIILLCEPPSCAAGHWRASVALHATLAGAICARSLVSKLTDSTSLDYTPMRAAVLRRRALRASVALHATLAGAICARSLTSKLVDSASLDYH